MMEQKMFGQDVRVRVRRLRAELGLSSNEIMGQP